MAKIIVDVPDEYCFKQRKQLGTGVRCPLWYFSECRPLWYFSECHGFPNNPRTSNRNEVKRPKFCRDAEVKDE